MALQRIPCWKRKKITDFNWKYTKCGSFFLSIKDNSQKKRFILNLAEIGSFHKVKYTNKWQPFPNYLTGFKTSNFRNKESKFRRWSDLYKVSLIASNRAGMETYWSFLTIQRPEFKSGSAIKHVVISWENKILLIPI